MERGGEDWVSRAKCLGADPEMFFPEVGQHTSHVQAFCNGTPIKIVTGDGRRVTHLPTPPCPVREECLKVGLEEVHGVWGGTTKNERDIIRDTKRGRRRSAGRPKKAG